MNLSKTFISVGVVCLFAAVLPATVEAQSVPGVPVSMVVTLEARRGKTIPPVEQQDIQVEQGKDKRPVTEFTPLNNSQDKLQLLLMIDDSARGSFDTEIGSLKKFVQGLPANSEVAVGYMRNGTTVMAHNFTQDHAAAANSIRIASGPGGADVSPYDSLSDAIKKWPKSENARKEVVMISSGIEGLGGGAYPENPYVQAGINDAVRAGVVVYTIYSPSVGHLGHSYWRNSWGQNFLSELSDQTGGDSFIIGFGSPVTFGPFLDEIQERLRHQYRLTFLAKPENKAGLQPVRVSVLNKDASIAAPDLVFVKAGK